MNENEQKLFNELIEGQNAQPKEEKFNWDEEFQRQILGLLISDKNFLIQSIGLVNPEYFTNQVHQDLFRIVYNYFKEYNDIPNDIIFNQELDDILKTRDDKYKIIYGGELEAIKEYYIPGIDAREYLLDKITNFAKIQKLKISFRECLNKLKQNPDNDKTWSYIYDSLNKAMNVDRNFDEGLDYFDSPELRYERKLQQIKTGEIFTSGFKGIDEALTSFGLARGEMGAFVGLSGVGKSLALVTAAVCNINKNKKVLYLSLEIEQDKVAERFDAQFLYNQNVDIPINKLIDNKDTVVKSLKEYVSEHADPKLLLIKQFPAGEMDMNMFRAYYAQILLNGFKPDVVIIDYVGEMQDYPNMPTWESRQRIVRDLRGFAITEQVMMLTALQPSKAAREVQKISEIDDDCLADAYGQIRPLDACWSINQTQDEKDARVGRIFVIKHRSGRGRFRFYIEYNKNTLALSEITMETYSERLNSVRHEKKERRDKLVQDGLLQDNIDDITQAYKSKKKKPYNDVSPNEV